MRSHTFKPALKRPAVYFNDGEFTNSFSHDDSTGKPPSEKFIRAIRAARKKFIQEMGKKDTASK